MKRGWHDLTTLHKRKKHPLDPRTDIPVNYQKRGEFGFPTDRELPSPQTAKPCVLAFEAIATAPHRNDVLGFAGVTLEVFAQADDEAVDHARLGVGAQSPDLL